MATATGLVALMSGAATAQSNEAHIVQDGNDNTAIITQGGELNRAGHVGYKTYPSDPILQNGDDNVLTINQVGSSNDAGVSRVHSDYSGSGIDQLGNQNSLTIDQLTNGSKVHQVLQAASSAATTPTNVLSITQSSHATTALISNRVNSVVQLHTGHIGVNSASIVQHTVGTVNGQIIGDGSQTSNSSRFGVMQIGAANTITAEQGNGASNRIVYLLQNGLTNTLSVTQAGTQNVVGDINDNPGNPATGIQQIGDLNQASVTQTGDQNNVRTVYQHGDGNVATLNVTGNSNGAADFTLGFEDLGLTQGVVIQSGEGALEGNGNDLSYTVVGSSNLFAFSQLGSDNSIVGTSSGADHQAAILQTGNNNIATFMQKGSSNALSVSQ